MKIIKRSLLITLPLFLTGCLAVGTFGKHERLITSFNIYKGKYNLNINSSTPKDYSENNVIEFWGKPDELTTNGCCTVLKYRTGISWAGIYASVIVPIPFAVPTGHDCDRLYIKDGKCVAIVEEYSEVCTAYGFGVGTSGGVFAFGKVNGPRKVPLDVCK